MKHEPGDKAAVTVSNSQDALRVERLTILYVEDEVSLRTVTARLLRRHGYDVIEADNGTEAITHARATRTDILITDLSLPGAPAAEVCTAVLATNPNALVIVVTGWSQIDEATLAVAPNAALLAKPFRSRDLLGKVATLLDQRLSPRPSIRP